MPPPSAQAAPARPGRTSLVLWLDAALLVLFLLAVAPRLTGLALHEVVGIVFCVPLLLHLLLSWPWINTGARRLLVPGDRRARVNYVINALLFVFAVTVVVSGLVISRIALPAMGIPTVDDFAWRRLHNVTVTWMHIAIGLHLAMNWHWIVAATRRQVAALARVRPSLPLEAPAPQRRDSATP